MDDHKNSRLTITDFNLISSVGQGTFAQVFLAQNKKSQKYYALKVFDKAKLAKKPSQQEQVMIEKSILSRLEHQFIIKGQFGFQDKSHVYLGLEYCPGGELFNLLCKKDQLTETEAKFYAAQLLLTIEYLHNQNIIFNDLKPENVLIDEFGYIKLADFGLSEEMGTLDKLSPKTCGTIEYMPPEMIEKKPYGKSVDWWRFGCIIYEMVVGVPPYQGKSKEQVFKKIVKDDPNYPGYLSRPLKELLMRLLNKDPQERMKEIQSNNGRTLLRQHRWFADIKWDDIIKRKKMPPYVPALSGSTDTSNFDPQFTKMKLLKNPYETSIDGNNLWLAEFDFNSMVQAKISASGSGMNMAN